MRILERIEEIRQNYLKPKDKTTKNLIKIDEKNKKNPQRKLKKKNSEESGEESSKKPPKDSQNICNFDFKLRFLKRDNNDDIDLQGRKASDKIKELCPSIQTTCCTENDIKFLFDQAQIGLLTNFIENTNYFQKMLNVINELKEENINKIIEAAGENLKECIVNDVEDFRNLLRDTNQSSPELREKYFDYALSSWEDVYKLQCGICDIKFSNYFNYKKSNKIPYKIQVDGLNEIYKFYYNLENYRPFFRLEKIYQVLNCVHFKKGMGIDVKKNIYPEEYIKLMKNKNNVGLMNNEKTQKFFLENYTPGGFRDIFFKRFVFLLVNSMSDESRFTEDKILAFWSPLDIQDISDKDFKVGNVKIEINDANLGYSSIKIKVSNINSIYTKELQSTIDYYRNGKEDQLFIEMKGSVIAIFLFIQMIILF